MPADKCPLLMLSGSRRSRRSSRPSRPSRHRTKEAMAAEGAAVVAAAAAAAAVAAVAAAAAAAAAVAAAAVAAAVVAAGADGACCLSRRVQQRVARLRVRSKVGMTLAVRRLSHTPLSHDRQSCRCHLHHPPRSLPNSTAALADGLTPRSNAATPRTTSDVRTRASSRALRSLRCRPPSHPPTRRSWRRRILRFRSSQSQRHRYRYHRSTCRLFMAAQAHPRCDRRRPLHMLRCPCRPSRRMPPAHHHRRRPRRAPSDHQRRPRRRHHHHCPH
jgi:hypothetical protein